MTVSFLSIIIKRKSVFFTHITWVCGFFVKIRYPKKLSYFYSQFCNCRVKLNRPYDFEKKNQTLHQQIERLEQLNIQKVFKSCFGNRRIERVKKVKLFHFAKALR